MRWAPFWLALASLAIPLGQAGSPEEPELVDEMDDVTVQGAVPAPWANATDLRAIWFDDDSTGLTVFIQVASLHGLLAQPGQVQSDAMFLAFFWTDHTDKSGRSARHGEWTLRADYQGINGWGYWAEAPCSDGLDYDGCSGADRDIIDAIPGSFDLASSTVRLTLPWAELGNVSSGDGIRNLTGSTQFVYPSYPLYAGDWDTDQKAEATYSYSSLPWKTQSTQAPQVGATVTVTVYAQGSEAALPVGGKAPLVGSVAGLAAVGVAAFLKRRLD